MTKPDYYAWGQSELVEELEKRDRKIIRLETRIELFEEENKVFAEAFKKLGYTDDQISDIASGAI